MSRWWTRWRPVVARLLAAAASLASILGVLLPLAPPLVEWPRWSVALLTVALFAVGTLVYLEIKTVRAHHVFDLADSAGVRRYLRTWIGRGGRVAIWTRDMSWAQNPDARALLTRKARTKELIICLPESTPLTDSLKAEGAEICAYGSLAAAPSSRFTIAFFERDGSRVAVGRAQGDNHVIDEFSSGDHPAFYIAEDLVRLARVRCGSR